MKFKVYKGKDLIANDATLMEVMIIVKDYCSSGIDDILIKIKH